MTGCCIFDVYYIPVFVNYIKMSGFFKIRTSFNVPEFENSVIALNIT